MMPRVCSANWCMNSCLEKELFRFPNDKGRCLIWARFCRRKDVPFSDCLPGNFRGWRLCEDHFSECDIISRDYMKLLRKNAVPLLHKKCTPSSLQNEPLPVSKPITYDVTDLEVIQRHKREEDLLDISSASGYSPILESFLNSPSKKSSSKRQCDDYFSEDNRYSRGCQESPPRFDPNYEQSSVKSDSPIIKKPDDDGITDSSSSLEVRKDLTDEDKFIEPSSLSFDSPPTFQASLVTKTYSGERNAVILGISDDTLSNIGKMHKQLKTYKKLVTNLRRKVYLLETELLRRKRRKKLR